VKLSTLNRTNQLILCLAIVAAGMLMLAGSASAATFTVNTTDDGNDANPGDGICEVNVGGGDCSLRALIEEANALGGADVGNFNIPGAGVQTFVPASDYPNIVETLTIDGSTQPSASCGTLVPTSLPSNSNTPHNLLIEVDATNIGFNTNLNIDTTNASNSTIRGLVLNRAANGSAIAVDNGATDVMIECNYVGTSTNGIAASANYYGITVINNVERVTIQNNLFSGNTNHGIDIGLSTEHTIRNNLVGTTSDGITQLANGGLGMQIYNDGQDTSGTTVNHNIFSGNGDTGALIGSASNWTVQDNYFGLDIAGDPLGNTAYGFVAYGTGDFTIGGSGANQRNYISANGSGGLHVYRDCSASSNTYNGEIFNNYIGTNPVGNIESGYGNQGPGIEVNEFYGGCVSVYRVLIGGDNAGEANIIAGNTEQGLLIHQSINSDVFSITNLVNSIFGNGQFGTDIASDSDGDNGIADVDLGPNPINNNLLSYPTNGLANNYLNHPTLNSVSAVGNDITVNYDFQANQADESTLFQTDVVGYRLDFYLNDAGQDGVYAGYSQGKTHVGSFVVNGSETNASHVFTSPVTPTTGQVVTATATVLWRVIPDPGTNCQGDRWGDGPPYNTTCIQ